MTISTWRCIFTKHRWYQIYILAKIVHIKSFHYLEHHVGVFGFTITSFFAIYRVSYRTRSPPHNKH